MKLLELLGLSYPTTAEGIEVLQSWTPQFWNDAAMIFELRQLFPLAKTINIFDPYTNRKVFGNDAASDWHQDATHGGDYNGEIALWSNTSPTQLRRVGSRTIVVPRTFDIVKFHNLQFEHRINPKRTGEARWFARIVFDAI